MRPVLRIVVSGSLINGAVGVTLKGASAGNMIRIRLPAERRVIVDGIMGVIPEVGSAKETGVLVKPALVR